MPVCFWSSCPEVPGGSSIAHIMVSKRIVQPCKKATYLAACGEEMHSWSYPRGSEPRFGHQIHAERIGLEVCFACILCSD